MTMLPYLALARNYIRPERRLTRKPAPLSSYEDIYKKLHGKIQEAQTTFIVRQKMTKF